MIRIISETEALTVLNRPEDRMDEALKIVAPIVNDVRLRGDEALREFRQRFDLVACDEPLYVDAIGELDDELQQAVLQASNNIQSFSESQLAP
ncbi:MAG: histidinol dehydrogenase, partial [Actinomycetota bacterium]|nr:histidinol dehydrogenase [Actinomycetota bacterium]